MKFSRQLWADHLCLLGTRYTLPWGWLILQGSCYYIPTLGDVKVVHALCIIWKNWLITVPSSLHDWLAYRSKSLHQWISTHVLRWFVIRLPMPKTWFLLSIVLWGITKPYIVLWVLTKQNFAAQPHLNLNNDFMNERTDWVICRAFLCYIGQERYPYITLNEWMKSQLSNIYRTSLVSAFIPNLGNGDWRSTDGVRMWIKVLKVYL